MPKVKNNKKAITEKTFTVVYNDYTFGVRILPQNDRAFIIRHLKHECAWLPENFNLINSSGHAVRLNFADLKHMAKYEAVEAAPPEFSKHDKKDALAQVKLGKIMETWKLDNACDIIPVEIAPRRPLLDGQLACLEHDPALHPVLEPGEWPVRFIVEVWKLAQYFPTIHKEACEVLQVIVKARHEDVNAPHYSIRELTTAGVTKAWELRRRDVAGESAEVADAIGAIGLELEEIEREIEVEDGVTLGTMNLGDGDEE
jgi:hypothetical protein